MRPIDADALIEKCGDWYVEEGTESGFIGTLKDLLATEPTIQPEKTQLSKEGATSDLIDRRAALDIFDDYNVSVENGELEAYSRDRKRMCELPPAQPEPTYKQVEEYCKRRCLHVVTDDFFRAIQPEPHEGHWIEGGIYRDVIECYCSECGQIMTTAATVRMNYCPNCGARMKGAQDG